MSGNITSVLETLEVRETRLCALDETLAAKRGLMAELCREIASLEKERAEEAVTVQVLRREWQASAKQEEESRATQSTAPLEDRIHHLEAELARSKVQSEDTVDALQNMLRLEQSKARALEADSEEARALKGLLLQKRCYQCHHQMVCTCEGFPALGVELSDAKCFDVDGVWVVSVVENGPAHAAGLLPNDVIYEWDGLPISTRPDMRQALSQAAPLQSVCLSVSRDPGDTPPFPLRVNVMLGSSRTKPQGVRPIKLKSPSKSRPPSSTLMSL
eukprot:TRINITY_DN15120_c0_g1_i1.p1 TRINITY_DN15120_c0_g1~~TRINITY_DN15120_c0_g1_i1.p1  ORF type:complete len:273 (+),score=92.92 TRINITY_DN15120_c0_g1_i1:60-878(+)